MQINRNNYEEFFLLYVDGELSAAERNAVEDFTAQNPDLLHELQILQETVLPADEISFDKSSLFKSLLIDEATEEKLLLKLDGELAANEAAGLDKMLAANAALSAEFDLLKKTKLDSNELIVFEDKHLLYRRERDNVVIGRFVRWAAAAVLIGIGLFIGYDKLNTAQHEEIAATHPAKAGRQTAQDSGSRTVQSATNRNSNNTASVNGEENTPDRSNDSNGKNNVSNNTGADHHNKDNNGFAVRKDNGTKTPDENGSNTTQDVITSPNNDAQKSVARADNGTQEKKITEKQPIDLAVNTKPKDESITLLENPYAHVAKLSETDDNDNKILYMDEDNVKKSKAGGLFRKVKRFVERTAKIKTGNSVSIGAFRLGSD